MTNSTYAPQRWVDVEASKIQPNIIGINSTITVNTTQDVDTLITDDMLIAGISVFANNVFLGDTVTIQIVDVSGTYFPANTVVSTPVLNYNMVSDKQTQADYQSVAPFKILGGLTIRIKYTSRGIIGNVGFSANLILQKVLV